MKRVQILVLASSLTQLLFIYALFFFLFSGRLPTVHDYRVFILNWEGRRRKRRSLGIVMSGFEEHIQLYLYNINKMNNKTMPQWEEFQNLIEKQTIPHCGKNSKI